MERKYAPTDYLRTYKKRRRNNAKNTSCVMTSRLANYVIAMRRKGTPDEALIDAAYANEDDRISKPVNGQKQRLITG